MADVIRCNRPLSPHLQVYRPQMTSMSSILVRITGIGSLCLSAIVVAWLVAAATSEQAFALVDGLVRSWLGGLVMLGGTWALFYHMLGRLRHVIWDLGYWVEVDISQKMAVVMLSLSTLLTLVVAVIL